MSTANDQQNRDQRERAQPDAQAPQQRRLGATLGITAGVLTVVIVLLYLFYYPSQLGPAQPIPFSHRFHAGQKGISCMMCHGQAIDSERAGVPPLETCMLCHEKIIVAYPQIEELRKAYAEGRPVEWVRVNELPDYVYFYHAGHVQRGIDCGYCHGDVRNMDRIEQAHDFQMGFCVQCHRDNGVSHDCYTCHR